MGLWKSVTKTFKKLGGKSYTDSKGKKHSSWSKQLSDNFKKGTKILDDGVTKPISKGTGNVGKFISKTAKSTSNLLDSDLVSHHLGEHLGMHGEDLGPVKAGLDVISGKKKPFTAVEEELPSAIAEEAGDEEGGGETFDTVKDAYKNMESGHPKEFAKSLGRTLLTKYGGVEHESIGDEYGKSNWVNSYKTVDGHTDRHNNADLANGNYKSHSYNRNSDYAKYANNVHRPIHIVRGMHIKPSMYDWIDEQKGSSYSRKKVHGGILGIR